MRKKINLNLNLISLLFCFIYFNLASQNKIDIKIKEITFNNKIIFKDSIIYSRKLKISYLDSNGLKIKNQKSNLFIIEYKKYKMIFDTSIYKNLPLNINLNDKIFIKRFFFRLIKIKTVKQI